MLVLRPRRTAWDGFGDSIVHGWGAGTFRLLEQISRAPAYTTGSTHNTILEALAVGTTEVQRRPVHVRVLDACAAPGGKTTHLLELADVKLTAIDHDATRLQRVSENLQRLRLDATVIPADVNDIQSWWDGEPFARILADVPCSASGVVRRHPDIKWLRRESDIAGFVAQQRRLLDSLWRLLAGGGKLLYTTCSIFQEENSLQIADFLERRADATQVPVGGVKTLDGIPDGQLLPDDEHDGFFYALLQKT